MAISALYNATSIVGTVSITAPSVVGTVVITALYTGMRKFRIDQDFLIEHWHMIYIMSVVFAEIYV